VFFVKSRERNMKTMNIEKEECKLMTKMPVCFKATLKLVMIYRCVREAEAGEEGDEEVAAAVVLVSTIAMSTLPGGSRWRLRRIFCPRTRTWSVGPRSMAETVISRSSCDHACASHSGTINTAFIFSCCSLCKTRGMSGIGGCISGREKLLHRTENASCATERGSVCMVQNTEW
jgi:hypothetical protein